VIQIPLQLLPRLCPFCGERTIIGHGQRLKQAHDQRHQQIWIRRGRCRPCQKTFTVLPDWSPPSGHYSLYCRQQAWELLRQANGNWERSVPDVADPSRSPDPSTVRRWAGRLLHLGTLLAAQLWQTTGWSVSTSPTILAWDWTAIRRILPLEASSP
jgi:hypothetical protein